MSSDPEQEYFSDGLSEEILNLLAKVPQLKVTARTSSFAFKGKNEDVRSIGKALNVNAVLEGSVRKSGERVRITAQLIDVASGTHLWSETYDRILTDIFAVQDSVASEILDALQVHVGAAPTRGRPTENPEAYSLALKAKAALGVLDGENAKSYSLKAIELDPGYAQAHELLAFSYWIGPGEMDPAEAQRLCHDAAAKALAIDPGLLFARALWEGSKNEDYSWHKDIQAFERTVREDPGHAEATNALIYNLLSTGYFEEALAIAERFVELDPLSTRAHSKLGQALLSNGRRSEAIASFEISDQLGMPFASYWLGILYLLEEQDEIAIDHLESFWRKVGQPAEWVREIVVGARDPETGQAHLDRVLLQFEDEAAGSRGEEFYLAFKFLDRFFEIIFEIGIHGAEWTPMDVLMTDATFFRQSGFTAHPRYLEVAESLDFFELWDERGAPDHCKKLDGQWACE
jgi:TolB-like protein